MARHEEAASYIRIGNSPAQIAKLMGISGKSVLGYLCQQIGLGQLKRYEVAHSIPRPVRQVVDEVIQSGGFKTLNEGFRRISKALENAELSWNAEDVLIYIQFRDAAYADMYELVRSIEIYLHNSIRRELMREFGNDKWWREGVPIDIREECATMRERDPNPAPDLFCYTTIINLKKILDKKWSLLMVLVGPMLNKDKQVFLQNLERLNSIRNSVMHPVKSIRIVDEDFEFVENLKKSLGIVY